MNFENYPNIANLSRQLGKSKQTMFNKKKFAEAENFWNSLSLDELSRIDALAPSAVRVMNCFVLPDYLFVLDAAVFYLIPVRDVVWVYTSVLTQRMNFIPYNKLHTLLLMDRNGKSYTLGTKNTGGFSKKTPCADAQQQVCDIIGPQRRGLLVGWSQQLQNAVSHDFAAVVQSVDANSMA